MLAHSQFMITQRAESTSMSSHTHIMDATRPQWMIVVNGTEHKLLLSSLPAYVYSSRMDFSTSAASNHCISGAGGGGSLEAIKYCLA